MRNPILKKIFHISRWLHVYLSTLFFSVLIFFSVTGLTLNHLDWLGEKSPAKTISETIPEQDFNEFFSEGAKQSLLLDSVSHYVSEKYDLRNPREVNFDSEINEVTFDFPLPAGYAFVIVQLSDQFIEIEYENTGLMALMNDLHKGRHTGWVWSWLIDISAVFVLIFSLSGLIILFQSTRRRLSGITMITSGTVIPIAIYFLCVPSFG